MNVLTSTILYARTRQQLTMQVKRIFLGKVRHTSLFKESVDKTTDHIYCVTHWSNACFNEHQREKLENKTLRQYNFCSVILSKDKDHAYHVCVTKAALKETAS